MRSTHINFVIAFFVIFRVNSNENGCDFGDRCFWIIENGFQIRTSEKLKDDLCKEATACGSFNNITGIQDFYRFHIYIISYTCTCSNFRKGCQQFML